LIALGEKQFETRSWRTTYRGGLGIHAGMRIDKKICEQEPFRSILAKHGYTAINLPTGFIIALGQLTGCYEVTPEVDLRELIKGNEYDFGDYSEGRFAWKLEDVHQLSHPVPAKGRLSLWEHPDLA